jgi:hypothetical protein
MHKYQALRGGDSAGNRWIAIVKLDIGWLASRRLLDKPVPDPFVCQWVNRNWQEEFIRQVNLDTDSTLTEDDILACDFVDSIIVFSRYEATTATTIKAASKYFEDSRLVLKVVELLNLMDDGEDSCAM